MKFLAIILSTFILVLSIVPFEDNYCGIQCEEISDSTHQDKENHDSESCPPLCDCQCSQIHVISVEHKDVTNAFVFADESKISCGLDNEISFDLLNSIWHPPKLVA